MTESLESKKKLSPAFRWVVLVATSLVCFAQYYIYDSITPLGTAIKEQLGFSGAQYGLLFSFYAAANIAGLLLVAGVLVDKLGIKISGILYGFLCTLGAALTAAGTWTGFNEIAWLHSGFIPEWSGGLKIMLLGRMIFGVGAESILVVNNKVLARWFTGKELAFAYGMNLFIMRLGTFLALNIQSPVSDWLGLRGALWFASGLMAVGALTFFIYLAMERVAKGREGAPATPPAADEKFVLKEAFSFGSSFWFITFLCVTFYSAVFPFQSYAPDILVQKFGYSDSAAGNVTSALTVGTMICTPIFGAFVDRKGKRATMMMLGALLLIPCHLLIGYTHVWPVLPIFVVGVALSLVPAALWAAIPLMVEEKRLGTAFGVVGYVQNVGLFLFPYLAGLIADAHTTKKLVEGKEVAVVDYTSTMLMFAALGVVGFLFAVMLKQNDKRKGGHLEAPRGGAPTQDPTPATGA